MTAMRPISQVAVVGTGAIGAGWAALFLAKGLDVVATDIAPGAEASLRRFVDAAWPALERLGLTPGASPLRLVFIPDLAEAVKDAGLVQENGPERLDFKQALFGRLDGMLPPHVIIASSSWSLAMSQIQQGAASHPERCVIGRPFDPPHLMPLVEIVGGVKTSEETLRRAEGFYAAIGKHTVRVDKEMPGHAANRLQAALAREVYRLVTEGVLSPADIDKVQSWGRAAGAVFPGAPAPTPGARTRPAGAADGAGGSRTIQELKTERVELLLGLLELRAKHLKI